jgi:DNA polymerase III subunit alpha
VKYVSLHHHSTYSFMDGFGTPLQHMERAAELGMEALALTEHGNVSSHVQLEKAAVKTGVRPIFGLEAYTHPDDKSRRKFHLTILAMNDMGYRNLMQLVSRSWAENYYQWPTVSGAMLAEHHEGLIVLSGCSDSLLACSLLGGKTIEPSDASLDRAQRQAMAFKRLLGDRFYLEAQMFPELGRTGQINTAYEDMSSRLGIPLVATADCHYPYPDDNEMQVILHAAGRGAGSVAAQEASWEYDIRLTPPVSDQLVMERLLGTGLSRKAAQGAARATAEIASRCHVVLPKAERLRFPVREFAPGVTSKDLIWSWLREGWKYRVTQGNKRMLRLKDDYSARLRHEMGLIEARDFIDYFLMLSDVVRTAKDKGIPVGPARGSAAASLVCYLLRITEIDPLEYPLMFFDRFIAPDREDLPDVDLDFDDERRHEIREHLVQRYGADRVGNIATFTKYKGKNSLDDVARVHLIPKADVEDLKGMIIERSGGDSRGDQALADTIEMFPQAAAIMAKHPTLAQAIRLEGNYRGMSMHAAGLVVTNTPIADVCALYAKEDKKTGELITSVSVNKYDAEYLNLLKADFLGLKTMGMIRIALDLAGLTLEELYRVPMDDAETLAAFRENDVFGIFQFEGRATRLVCRDVKPDNFLELADINGLSRPGPLFSGTTAEYIDVKHGRKKATRFHPIIDKLTEPTKGQIIYQEQVLEALRTFGGLPVKRVHDIRRIISQKLGEAQFNESAEDFARGARELHGVEESVAREVWKRLVTSATYSFNIAHCVSYSMLAFWCMWIKVHYPTAFYTAQLRKIEEEKWPRLIRDAEKHGIRVKGVTPGVSGRAWQPVTWTETSQSPSQQGTVSQEVSGIVAGWEQLRGVGESKAAMIMQYDAERRASVGIGIQSTADLLNVKGIGPKSLEAFAWQINTDDPFGLKRVERSLAAVRTSIRTGEIPLGNPTCKSGGILDITGGEHVVWLGMVRLKEYKDYVEDERARSGLPVEEIRKNMQRPDLPTSCVLHCYDDDEEDVYVRITRFKYPEFKTGLARIRINKDVAFVVARKSKGGFGASLYLENLIVIDPE